MKVGNRMLHIQSVHIEWLSTCDARRRPVLTSPHSGPEAVWEIDRSTGRAWRYQRRRLKKTADSSDRAPTWRIQIESYENASILL